MMYTDLLNDTQLKFLKGELTELTVPTSQLSELKYLSMFLKGKLIPNLIKNNKNTGTSTLKVYTPQTDEDTYDGMLEDLNGVLLFGQFNKQEEILIKRAEKMLETGTSSYHYFMPTSEFKCVRFDLLAYYLQEVNLTVLPQQGVVILTLEKE